MSTPNTAPQTEIVTLAFYTITRGSHQPKRKRASTLIFCEPCAQARNVTEFHNSAVKFAPAHCARCKRINKEQSDLNAREDELRARANEDGDATANVVDAASTEGDEFEALMREADGDYTMKPEATSIWITVRNISVYIKQGDEGVSVELHPRGGEWGDPLSETWATYGEAE